MCVSVLLVVGVLSGNVAEIQGMPKALNWIELAR